MKTLRVIVTNGLSFITGTDVNVTVLVIIRLTVFFAWLTIRFSIRSGITGPKEEQYVCLLLFPLD